PIEKDPVSSVVGSTGRIAARPPSSGSRLGSDSLTGSSENNTSLSPEVAHIRLVSLDVPQTMLSSTLIVPHMMLSPAAAVPHTMLSPSVASVLAVPQTTFEAQALAVGLMIPPFRRWLPQTMDWLNVGRYGYLSPGFAYL